MQFAVKVLKFHSQIFKFQEFALDISGKEDFLFTSLQYVESSHASYCYWCIRLFIFYLGESGVHHYVKIITPIHPVPDHNQ
jgi:hypothetical protein